MNNEIGEIAPEQSKNAVLEPDAGNEEQRFSKAKIPQETEDEQGVLPENLQLAKKEPQTIGRRNARLGQRGEKAAAHFLDRRGYEIIERNWVCVAGEADIIARDGDALVFVEVKTRSSLDKGFPSDAVDAEKRSRYERIAALFLQGYNIVDVSVRFDVVSLVVLSSDRAMIRHHINAFAAG